MSPQPAIPPGHESAAAAALAALEAQGPLDVRTLAAGWRDDGLPQCPRHPLLSYPSLQAGRCLRCLRCEPEQPASLI